MGAEGADGEDGDEETKETTDGVAAPPTIQVTADNADTADTPTTPNPTVAESATASTAENQTHGVPLEIPSNAIEMTNTAPVHTEQGTGDLGVGGAGAVEFVQGESHVESAPSAEKGEGGDGPDGGDGMDVDVDEETAVPDAGVAPETDAGLVMGEMHPEVKELEMTEEDKAKEVEQ